MQKLLLEFVAIFIIKLKNVSLITIYATIGFGWIFFYLYRLGLTPDPVDFMLLSPFRRYVFIVISLLWIIFSACRLFILLKRNHKKGFIFSLTHSIIENFYYKPFRYLWDYVFCKIPLLSQVVYGIGWIITLLIKNLESLKVHTIMLFYFPRVIILCILFAEMVIYKKLNVFYTFGCTFMVTLFFTSLLYILQKTFQERKDKLENTYLIVDNKNGINVCLTLKSSVENPSEYLLQRLTKTWIRCQTMVNICRGIEHIKSTWTVIYSLEILTNIITLQVWFCCLATNFIYLYLFPNYFLST